MNEKIRKAISVLFVVVFFATITFPLAGYLMEKKNRISALNENRYLSKFPQFSKLPVTEWPKAFSDYLSDNNLYRDYFMERYFLLHEWYLRAPLRYAFRGSDSQMFMLNLVKRHSATPLPADEEFRIQAALYGCFSYFNQAGAFCVITIPPDKETMLDDNLPNWVVKGPWHSLLDKLRSFTEKWEIPYVDLTDVRDRAEIGKMYNKYYDLYHWNAYGMHAAYQKAAEFLRGPLGESFKPAEMGEEYDLYETDENVIMGFKEKATRAKLLHPDNFTADTWHIRDFESKAKNRGDNRGPTMIINNILPGGKMLFVGDSYTQDASVPHLKREDGSGSSAAFPFVCNVREMGRIWSEDCSIDTFDRILPDFKPEVVFLAFCERALLNIHPQLSLYGDHKLGNLGIDLYPVLSEMELSQKYDRSAFVLEKGDSGGIAVLSDSKSAGIRVNLPSVTTSEDGYVAIGGRIVCEGAGAVRLIHVNAANGKSGFLAKNLSAGDNFVYFQIVGEPKTKYDVSVLIDKRIGTFQIVPTFKPEH